LDKIAFFMNQYMTLGIPERRVSFRTLWYEKQERSRGLRPEFASLDNWPLRGLFWLAKDVHDETPSFRASLAPDAQRLAEIRNHMEHKYLKVHDQMWIGPQYMTAHSPGLSDTLAYSIYREELGDACMVMLKLARAGLMYLSLGIHTEEHRRARKRPPGQRIGASPIMSWPNDWKR
jgi:hypothetical protein